MPSEMLHKMYKLSEMAKKTSSRLKMLFMSLEQRIGMAMVLANNPAIPTMVSNRFSVHHEMVKYNPYEYKSSSVSSQVSLAVKLLVMLATDRARSSSVVFPAIPENQGLSEGSIV